MEEEKILKASRSGIYSDKYREWVKQSGLPPLTNTQHHFAEFLLENEDEIKKVGNLEVIFKSIRKYFRK